MTSIKIPLYFQDGSQQGDVPVSEKIFGRKVNAGLIHKAYTIQLGNRRHPIAHTLTKGEVRGGGKKPYKQKHTGWARQGSITNPHFRGGGVAFGPRNERNYKRRLSKTERRAALFSSLSAKLSDKQISALESYVAEKAKTKEFASMLKKLPFKKKVLFVLPGKNDTVSQSSRNIPKIKTIPVHSLNVADVVNFEDIVFFKEAIPKLEDIFLKAK
ncbi:50S ribosomal protein L4 [Candidatus Peregrinibacteria bacterium]|nr:50S ribosomal protein L4 [Candidatus Peregrinibacteria bacterium]